jgi:hypothetical protein
MSKCFISHADGDRSFVEGEILGLVEAIGLEPWFAPESIKSGDQWEESILTGLEESEWFILVMSQTSALSKWVKAEVAWAMKHLHGRIIPVLIHDCDISQFHPELFRIQHIDFRSDPKKGGMKLIKQLVDDQFHPIRRASSIVGNWAGNVRENEGPKFPEGLEYPVEASIRVRGTDVSGQFSINLPVENATVHIVFNVTGGFSYERFLQLNYKAKETGAIQFGSIIAALSDEGRSMKGSFVGYSAQQEDIVTGSVTMTKSA